MKSFDHRKIINLSPFFLITAIYILFRLFLFSAPLKGDYSLDISIRTVINTFWYVLWTLNFPENIKEHLTFLPFSISHFFIIGFKPLLPIATLSYSLFIAILFLSILKTKIYTNWRVFILAAIFLVGLLPVIFFTDHTYSYYVTFSSLALFIFLGFIFKELFERKFRTLAYLLLLFWSLSALTSTMYMSKNHWVTYEQKISRNVTERLNVKKNNLNNIENVFIYPVDIQVIRSLMDQNAIQVLLENTNVQTNYSFLTPNPTNMNNTLIINLNEKI